jgi:hypothetical protein
VALQDGPGTRRSKDDTRPDQLTMDPAVAPGGVFAGQSEDDRDGACWDTRSTVAVGVTPSSPDKIPVPAEQGLGLDEESHAMAPVKEPTQPGEQGSIRRAQGGPVYLAAKDSDLMTEHDDFNGQLVFVAPTEEHQLEDSDESEVEKR